MDHSQHPELRGYDSYEVKLGDELRGHRATRGKSLLDVQRDLRIRASYIDAIENCDPSVMPNKGFVAGYVRAYARYLDLDGDAVYARFCAESGFSGGAAAQAGSGGRGGSRGAAAKALGPDPTLSRSHFAAPVGRAQSVGIGVSLSGILSVAVVAGLVGGLGWGGWTILQEVQRVEFAPVNESPDVAGAPQGLALPDLSLSALAAAPAAPALDPARDAALAALYAPLERTPPALKLRDGPIAAIDPDSVGVFAGTREDAPRRETRLAAADRAAGGASPDDAAGQALGEAAPMDLAAAAQLLQQAALRAGAAGGDPVRTAGGSAADHAAAERAATPAAEFAAEPAPEPARSGVWIVASEPAWLRVRLRDGSTLVQRIFQKGDRYQIPEGIEGARMRAGNAGSVWVEVDGVLHGPMGRVGGVAKNVALDADAVRAAFQAAAYDPLAPVAPGEREEARLELE